MALIKRSMAEYWDWLEVTIASGQKVDWKQTDEDDKFECNHHLRIPMRREEEEGEKRIPSRPFVKPSSKEILNGCGSKKDWLLELLIIYCGGDQQPFIGTESLINQKLGGIWWFCIFKWTDANGQWQLLVLSVSLSTFSFCSSCTFILSDCEWIPTERRGQDQDLRY